MLNYYLYRLAGALAPRVSPQLGYALAERIGAVLYPLSPLRHNVEANTSHVLGAPMASPRVQQIARRVYINQCKNYFDLFRLPALSLEGIAGLVTISGVRHLDRALSRGSGVVLAGAHVGNVDVAGQILGIRGYKVTALAEHLRPERLFQYVRRTRESHGLTFIPIDGSLRPVFRALRANEIVGSAIDRDVTDAGREVLFFGEPARLPDGYLKLALRTRASLVVAFSRRLPDETFTVTVHPEVELERTGELEHDIAAGMPKVLSLLSAYLSSYPEQWVYFQPMWVSSQRTPGRDGAQPGPSPTRSRIHSDKAP